MKNKLAICTLIAFSVVSNLSYAKKYKQTIKLTASGNEEGVVCFVTTDVFDGKHCGNGAKNTYDKGPKNYYLKLKKGSIKYDDPSCQTFFEGKQRTPEATGTLTITVNANSSAGYIGVSSCTAHFEKK